jgi:hypothetical protein
VDDKVGCHTLQIFFEDPRCAGDLHFITGSCYHRRAFLGPAKRRDLFLTVLERIRERHE